MTFVEFFALLAAVAYGAWWVYSMTSISRETHRCPLCKTYDAWYRTGRVRELSNEPVYQRNHLWTIKQIEWRCRECHYTLWHPWTCKDDDNLVA